jgi:hypothetical protein
MHVGTVWTMLIALSGAAVLVIALRPTRKPTDPAPEQVDVLESAHETGRLR